MFAKTKNDAAASAQLAKKNKEFLAMAVGTSSRRIKEMAKQMKPFIQKARLEGLPSEQEGLDFVAGLFGFESYQAACSIPPSFIMHPGFMANTGPRPAPRGSLFNNKRDPLAITSQEMLGGGLLLGSTGAGKTEALLSLAASAMEAAPALGLLFFDGKGDFYQIRRVLSLLKKLDREHDFRLLNLIGMSAGGLPRTSPQTHRFDPIFGMDAPRIANWMRISLGERLLAVGPAKDLPSPEDASDVMDAMLAVWAYDAIDLMRNSEQEPGVAALVAAAALPDTSSPSDSSRAKSWRLRLRLLQEDPQSMRAFSAMRARALLPLSTMIQSYPEIFRCVKNEAGEWLQPEMRPDSPLLGHACMVLLPALEKSEEELVDLGHLLTASFQDAMAVGDAALGMRSMAIFDEFGYYAPPISGLMAAARRAGVGLLLAAQDIHAAQHRSRRHQAETLSSLASLRLKFFMKLEDPDETYKFISACFPAGRQPCLLDLKEQREGEAWIVGSSTSGPVLINYRGDLKIDQATLPKVKCQRRAHGD